MNPGYLAPRAVSFPTILCHTAFLRAGGRVNIDAHPDTHVTALK